MAKKVSQEDAIQKLVAVHGDTYDYSNTVYIGATSPISITCKVHGEFTQRYAEHRSGSGCVLCSNAKRKKKLTTPTQDILAKCREVHNNKYDYSLVPEDAKLSDHVNIICKVHGQFKQRLNHHSRKTGCKHCAVNGFNESKIGAVYLLQSGSIFKIGVTNRKIKVRVAEINKSSGLAFTVVNFFKADGVVCAEIERMLLSTIKGKFQPVTQSFDGSTECVICEYPWYMDNLFIAAKLMAPPICQRDAKPRTKPVKSKITIEELRKKQEARTGVPVGVSKRPQGWVFQRIGKNSHGNKDKILIARFDEKEDCIEFAKHYWNTGGDILDTKKNLMLYQRNGLPIGVVKCPTGFHATYSATKLDGTRIVLHLGTFRSVEDADNARKNKEKELEGQVYARYKRR